MTERFGSERLRHCMREDRELAANRARARHTLENLQDAMKVVHELLAAVG